MIYVQLSAQLGNHMFQYAAARVQAERLGTNVAIYSPFSEHAAVRNAISRFPNYQIFKEFPDLPFTYVDRGISLYQAIFSGLFKINNPFFIKHRFYPSVSQPFDNEGYDADIWNIFDNTLLVGYFQSERYFIKYRSIILENYKPSKALAMEIEIIQKTLPVPPDEMVAVHVRLGDYLVQQGELADPVTGWALSENYYKRALEEFHPKTPIALFSNDMDRARKLLPRNPAWESPAISAGFDLHMMSSFKNLIIGNSTFSWWSAWLNQDPNKKIIGPEYNIGWRKKEWWPAGIEVKGWIYV